MHIAALYIMYTAQHCVTAYMGWWSHPMLAESTYEQACVRLVMRVKGSHGGSLKTMRACSRTPAHAHASPAIPPSKGAWGICQGGWVLLQASHAWKLNRRNQLGATSSLITGPIIKAIQQHSG